MTLKNVKTASLSNSSYQSLVYELKNRFNDSAETIERILKKNNQNAANLAVRSRRAYQWIKFLANENNLQSHLDTLQRINLFLPGIQRSGRLSGDEIEFSLYHLGSLYKFQKRKNFIRITTQESFLNAPDKVLIAILQETLLTASDSNRQIIREYANSPTYLKVREYLEYLSLPEGSFAQGQTHNLSDSYLRVNQRYFNGMMPKPHLVWNNRMTRKKFGHYQKDTDTVMVSISLDHPRIPPFVVDYVMYHELLHKQLGVRQKNNRRYTHTNDFKQKELEYKRFHDAQQFLQKLSRK